MFWIKTIKEIKQLSLERYKVCSKRINTLSDYIQGPLQEIVDKAVDNYFKELEKIITNQRKKRNEPFIQIHDPND